MVTAEYQFGTASGVNNIAAYSAVADETVVKFNNPVITIAQNGKYLYVKDNSGFGLFYGDTGNSYVAGDVIPAGFVGRKTTYGGEPELTDLSNFQAASSNTPIDPETITTAQVNHSTWAHYVYLENVTIDPEAKTLTDAVGTAPVYFSMGVTANQVSAGVSYNVWAVVGSYKPSGGDLVYQLLPIKVKKNGGPGNGIGTLFDLDDNANFVSDVDAIVLHQAGTTMYIKDETGYGLCYGTTGHTYNMGDVIPAGWGGTKVTYNAKPELKNLTGFQAASGTVTVNPDIITPSQVGDNYWAHLVLLKGVMVTIDGDNGTITDATGSCPLYNRTFGAAVPGDLSQPLDVLGIVASYQKGGQGEVIYQILPIKFDGGGEVPPTPVQCFNELYALNSGTIGIFTKPITTIYQNGLNLYVKDFDGHYSLAYGSVNGTFRNGDFITDAQASWTTYQNAPQLKPVAETFIPAGHAAKAEPEVMPIEEVSQDMIHWYLGFEEVEIIEEDSKFYMKDETGQIQLFDKFNITITPGGPYYIEGFLTVYKGELELYPILIDDGGGDCGTKGDVNGDNEINIADINALIDIILGGSADDCTMWRADFNGDVEVNIADINALIDYILNN